jgi:CRP/FNR family transcriptional regulator, cyclic AMP receptor protein
MPASRLNVLSGASAGLRELVESLATRIHVKAGTTLFRQGDEGETFYLVREGEIEISVLSPAGRRLALDVMRKGDLLGEIALFGGSRTATATTLKPSLLDQVWRSDVMAAIRERPELALQFIDLLCERLRTVSAKLEERAFMALPARMASRLLHLDRKIGDGVGRVPVSQAELADFVGATREGVAKVLAEWRELGWVALSRGSVRIVDRAAVEALAQGTID